MACGQGFSGAWAECRFLGWGVVFLLAVHAFLVGWIGWNTSPTETEVGHMTAAVYFWNTHRFDVFHVNPPLTRMVTGLPVVMCRPNYNWNLYSPHPQDRSEWAIGKAFLAANSVGKIQLCFVLARLSLIPLLLLGGYFGYRLSREIYGKCAAFVFLNLWCFSPLLLAWGATICPDAVAASLGIVAVYTLHGWLSNPNWTRAAIAGFCLGLLPLTKLTWIIALGIWPLIWCMWAIPIYLTKLDKRSLPLPSFCQLMFIIFIALYTLNIGYLFDETFRPLGKYEFISQLLCGPEVPENQQIPVAKNRFIGTWLNGIPVPLPAEFVQGMDTQKLDFERGMPSYLRGEWADHGWWYYYIYALSIKVPLGTWCLIVLAIGATILTRGYSATWRDEMMVLTPGLAIFAFVSSQTGFSIHSRYVIPALPFCFIWISKVARVFEMYPFTRKRLSMAVMVVMALTWSIGSSLSIYPHSLSYFNELTCALPTPVDASYPRFLYKIDGNRGILSSIKHTLNTSLRNGPRHLLGSNIDWGQDLLYLENWCRSHPESQPIKVACCGVYPLDRSKIKSAGSPPMYLDRQQIDDRMDPTTYGPWPGWYAVSINEIYGRSQHYRYFLRFEPVAMAGYSIYIYHITPEEANQVRRELGLAKWGSLPARKHSPTMNF